MIKEDIIRFIHNKHGGKSLREIAELVDLLLDEITESIVKEGKLLISGFGKFEIKIRASRRIADPNSGDRLIIPKRRALTFKASPLFFGKAK